MVLPRAGDRGGGTQITVIYIGILFVIRCFMLLKGSLET
jgi:hypothetical protein